MKRLLLTSIILTVLCLGLFAQARTYTQKVVLSDGTDPIVTNYDPQSTAPDYIIEAYLAGADGTPLGYTMSTDPASPNHTNVLNLKLKQYSATNLVKVVQVNILAFNAFGSTTAYNGLRVYVRAIYTGGIANETGDWWFTVVPTTTNWNVLTPAQIIPPFPAADQTLTITSNPTGQPIYMDTVDTGHVTPWDFLNPAEGSVFTVVNPLYTWDPVPYTVPADFETATVNFVGTFIPIVVKPNPAINPTPADGATIQRAWDAVDAPVMLSWEPNTEGPAPVGYKLEWNGGEAIVLPNVTQWETPALGAGEYTWKVIPYANDITEPGKSVNVRATRGQRTIDGIKGDADACPTWTFTVAYDEAPDYPPTVDVEIVVGGQTIIVTVTGGNAMNDAAPGVTPPWPNPNQVDDFITLWFDGSGVTTFTIATTAPYGAFWNGANWIVAENALGVITFTVDFGAKAPKPIILGPVDPTLPVVLSSFTAVLTAQNYVQLNWITESETNMLGFRVYRSETTEVSDAVLITPVMIGATNTSSTQHYSVTDNEVVVGTTYNYWLESVDMGHSTFHGPQTVTVSGTTTPNLPSITQLGNAYPNPFRASTNISLAVKEGETATVTIYNILGQVVRTYNKTQGSHTINWDGRDARGNACGSGIYFYKLSSPSMNQTKKMVIVK